MIIPCHPRNRAVLPRALRSLEAAASGLDVETVVVDDPDSRGPSWARNRGIERATGEVVFFCDADDEVKPGFFSRPLAELERTDADICFFAAKGEVCRTPRVITTSIDVRRIYLPQFFGCSFDDVERWNAGGPLLARRRQGPVWQGAYRKDFLDRHALRFDETMTVFEDAAFLSEAVVHADKVVEIEDDLYVYRPNEGGALATGLSSRRIWDYKFAALAFRLRLARENGGDVWKACEGSVVMSALELFRLRRVAGIGFGEFRKALSAYFADPAVRESFSRFPISLRHPSVALGVLSLRLALRFGLV